MNLKNLLIGSVALLAIAGAVYWIARPSAVASVIPTGPAGQAASNQSAAKPEEILATSAGKDARVTAQGAQPETKRLDHESPKNSSADGTSPGVPPSIEILPDDGGRSNYPRGAAAAINPISGGVNAIESAYRNVSAEKRAERRQVINDTLALYEGDPPDEREFQLYQQLKEEVYWLEAHPKP